MKMKIRNKAAFTDAVTPLEEDNREISYRAALEGIVLLENDGTLPLAPGKIALYGAGAGMTIKGGTGSGEVNERHAVTILEGLERAGFTVTTERWIEEYENLYREGEEEYRKDFQRKLRRMTPSEIMNYMSVPYQYPFGQPITEQDINESDTDTCIYVIARQAGEGSDKRLEGGEYALSDEEKTNIEVCAAAYEKMIVVINTGASFDLGFLNEIGGINAVVFFAQQGMEGGRAFADLISGRISPSGKTADTWAKRYEDIPFAEEYSYLNGNVDEEYYREGIYVGYRYFDSFGVEPRYPFGYGLSYTEFSVETERTEVIPADDAVSVNVRVKVTNTGTRFSGKEVVQLYVSCPQTGAPKEYQKLAAFAKTEELKPGHSGEVCLCFDLRDMAYFREEDASYVLEAGDYVVRVGTSSRDTQPAAVIVLDEDAVTEICRPVCGRDVPVREIEPPEMEDTAEQQDEDVERIAVKAADIPAVRRHRYESEASGKALDKETEKLLNSLTEEEMCELTVGAGMNGKGPRYFEAPGSAGYTTGRLLDRGIPNICLADGPAGLRLQRVSTVTRGGRVKGTTPTISAMKYFPEIVKKFTLGNPEKQPCVYQFATSFPVALSIAQSWNTELAREVGEAVGKEMEAYGVTYWLAPALNIHRNPLCGRNFEYYSEDPLLSGKTAAAVTRGIQSRRGCFATVKHFCCNNQEDNRNRTNANINERALREIYLRGFRIAVEEGRPGAVMSSYNKVNGNYVNNSRELLTGVLRCEWGFDGLVMTDWLATGKGLGSHVLAQAAGNDLIMPGGSGAVRELKKAVKSGELKKEELRRCAANVLRGITGSRIYQAYRRQKTGATGRKGRKLSHAAQTQTQTFPDRREKQGEE